MAPPHLHIIDALGPFVEENHHREINWSKVNFIDLEKDGRLPARTQKRVIERFDRYVKRVSALGYDSLSIDDLAHLVAPSFYNDATRQLLADYRSLYKKLFAIARARDMKLFVNTDYLFYNDDIHRHLAENHVAPDEFFLDIVQQALNEFPEIDGIILRIGEHDGKDVKNTFLSHITLRTPKQANTLLKKLLPLFEEQGKLLIFRTWTVGVYKIGDLIWNQRTFDAVFGSVASDALIISMKFGDTDFMRYLPLNPLFSHSPHKKLIELQTRREWEGMGTYPSFVGWDYARYLEQLVSNPTVVGINVWCQTGGWAKASWSNVTYLENSSFWNELNTEVTIALTRGQTVEEAVGEFCRHRNIADATSFTRLLELSDIAIKNGLYFKELAEKQFYFRRSRIPSLTWLTWDRVLLQPTLISLLRLLVSHPVTAIKESKEALQAVEEMVALGEKLSLGQEVQNSLRFQRATFSLFVSLRRYLFGFVSADELPRLNRDIATYAKTYPQHYTVPQLRAIKRRRIPRRALNILLREVAPYRKRDKIIMPTSPLQRKIVTTYLRRSKSHLADQSMGFDAFFK